MTQAFASRLTLYPQVFDRAVADEVALAFADLSAPLRDLISASASCAPYLRDLSRSEAAWLRQALTLSPEDGFAAILAQMDQGTDLSTSLRQAKRRAALMIALADLGGIWDLGQVTDALTQLADCAVQLCMSSLVGDEMRRGKLPQGDPALGAGMVVLAMGKMGAGELNYSSDIDPILLFDRERLPRRTSDDPGEAAVRIARRMR